MSHTFSCALQTIDVDGVPVSFEADTQDYHLCRLRIGDIVVTFNRNGAATGWHREEERPAVEHEAAADDSQPDPAENQEGP